MMRSYATRRIASLCLCVLAVWIEAITRSHCSHAAGLAAKLGVIEGRELDLELVAHLLPPLANQGGRSQEQDLRANPRTAYSLSTKPGLDGPCRGPLRRTAALFPSWSASLARERSKGVLFDASRPADAGP